MIPRNRLLRRRRSRSENSSRSKSSWLFSRITRFFSSLACCFHKAATIIAPIEEDEYGSGSFNEETFIASSARVNCKSDSQLGDVESETEPVKPALESSSTNQHDDWDIEKTPSYSDQIEDPKSSSSCKEIERVNSKCTSSVDEVYSGKDSASQLQKEVPENKSKLRFLNNGRLVLPKEDDDDDYDIALDISRQVVANVVRSFQKVKKPCPQISEETFVASSARVNCKSDNELGDAESETEPVKPALESSSTDQHDDWDIEKTPSYSDQIEDPKSSSSCKENERVNSKCTSMSVDEVDSGKDSASQLQKEVPENKSKLRFLNNGRLVLPKEDDDDDYDIALDISRQVVANVVRSFEKVKKPCPQISEETFVASSARVNCKSDNELGDAESETEPVKPALESSSTDQHDDWDIEKTPSYSDQIEDPKSSSSCKENERVNSKCTSMSVDEVDSGKDSASQLQKEVPENKSKLRFLNNGRLVLPKEDDDDDYDIALDISRQVVANVVRSFEKVKKPCPQTNEGISASWIPGAAENVISTKNYFYMFLPLGEVTDLQRQSQHLSLQVNNVFTEGNEDENYYAEIIEEDYDDVELNHIFIQHRCHSAYPSVSRKIQEDDDEMLDEDVKIAPPQCSMVQMLY
eukprot:gene14348-15844_t